jgi:hypothetical protein
LHDGGHDCVPGDALARGLAVDCAICAVAVNYAASERPTPSRFSGNRSLSRERMQRVGDVPQRLIPELAAEHCERVISPDPSSSIIDGSSEDAQASSLGRHAGTNGDASSKASCRRRSRSNLMSREPVRRRATDRADRRRVAVAARW